MADLLTHVLVVYVLATVASWWAEPVTRRWVAVAMGGAAIPDLVKIDLVIDDAMVSTLLDVPFRWDPISMLGGVLVIAGVITLAFDREYWKRTYGYLLTGGVASLVVDGLRVYADGQTNSWLYPFTWWRPPTPSLYVTSDPRVLVAALTIAAVVAAVDLRRRRVEASTVLSRSD